MNTTATPSTRESAARERPSALARYGPALGLTLLALLFAAVVVRTAWVADDAFITFRTVTNALDGYGLRWNVAERVQTYTHPLWMLLLLAGTAVTHNAYLSALGLSFVLTACTAGLILTIARWRPAPSAFALLAMIWSSAFVDYSTSGLENTLSHALLALLLAAPVAIWLLRELLIAAQGAAPFWDALTTVISLGALALQAGKRIDNWLWWIAADLVYVPLYLWRGLPLTALLYAIFLAMCLVGWRQWRASLAAAQAERRAR